MTAPFVTEAPAAVGGGSSQWVSKRRLWSLLVAVILLITAWGGTYLFERIMVEERLHYRHDTVREGLIGLRARLDAALTANLLVGQGMAAFVAANPNLRDDDFYAMARNLLSHRSQVLNIALAQGTVITHVYPMNGNASVLGVDYRSIPDQWPSVEQVITEGHAVLNGPVQRVQGGIAVIARFPIYLSARQGQGSRYWGLVALPIDLPALLTKAGVMTPLVAGGALGREDRSTGLMVDIAIRGRDGNGSVGDVFFGNPGVFDRQPETLELLLPSGSWQIAAVPSDGWMPARVDVWFLRGAGGFFGLLLAAFGYAVSAYVLRSLERPTHADGLVFETVDGAVMSERAFLDAAESEMATSLRYRRAVGFLVIALDKAPAFFAQWDEQQQREMHEQMAIACRNALRPSDLLTARGDGEFAALLIGANRDGAIMAADRVRRAIKSITPPVGTTPELLTASVGAAVLRDGDPDAVSALNRAADRLRVWQASGADGVAL